MIIYSKDFYIYKAVNKTENNYGLIHLLKVKERYRLFNITKLQYKLLKKQYNNNKETFDDYIINFLKTERLQQNFN